MVGNIFDVLDVLVPGGVLALFAAYYQTRKKNEILIETEIAKVRVSAYEDIVALLSQVMSTITPSLDEEKFLQSVLGHFDCPTRNVDYPQMFADEKSFDAFYTDLKELGNKHYIYFGYDVEKQFQESISLYSTMKLYLDAFSDAERGYPSRITSAYNLAAIIMRDQVNASFLKMEDLVSIKLSEVEVRPKRRPLKVFMHEMLLPLYRLADAHLHQAGWKGAISNVFLRFALGKDRLMVMHRMLNLVGVMTYLHYSDTYSPSEWFALSQERQQELHRDFMKIMRPQIHRG